MAAEPIQRKLFTTDEYHAMLEAGILSEDDRVELIEGEIWEMSPIGSRHAGCVNSLTEIFAASLRGRAVVSIQNPIHLGKNSEPQPDVSVLRYREDRYRDSLADPGDVLLVVEVADSSQKHDQRFKMPLYARHGIPEAWRVEIGKEFLQVHRSPSPQGYQEVLTFRRGDTLSPLAFPDLVVQISEILG